MKSFTREHLSVLIIPILLFFCTASQATEDLINITADRMVATEKTNSVTFTGNVDARQGDVQIRSDKMDVYYIAKSQKKERSQSSGIKQQVEKLICTGNVEVTRGDWLGTADRMDYLERKRQVVLSGNARAWQGENMVNGSKIIYYLDEGRSEVVAGEATLDDKGKQQGGRVHMKIFQK